MDNKTVKQLNEVNRQFYLSTSKYFNKSRQYYWQGWEKLISCLSNRQADLQGSTLKVLDVGCGNGRLGKFLKERLKKIDYVGIDENKYLLNQAKKTLSEVKLIEKNVLDDWELKDKFDLIAIIGLLHHIPGKENRLKILKRAKKLLSKDGVIILTIWQFNKLKRMKRKIVSWKEFIKLSKKEVDLSQLEEGDTIIDWKRGPRAFRYCHLMDGKELKWLVKKLEMKIEQDFVSDSKQGQGNRYILLKKS